MISGYNREKDWTTASQLFSDVFTRVAIVTLGSLSNDDSDVNENDKKAIVLDWQNDNSSRASRFFVHYFGVTARLRRETAQFHVLSRTRTQDNNFIFLFLNYDSLLEFNQRQKKLPPFDELNEME